MSSITETVFIGIILVLTVTLNFLLLFVIGTRYSYIDVPHLFITSISICDILQAILGYVPELLASLRITKVTTSEGGSWICIGSALMTFLFTIVIIMHFVLLSILRTVALKYPVFYAATFVEKRLTFTLLLLCYMYGTVWPVLPVLKWSKYAVDIDGKRCSLDWRLERKDSFSYIICVILVTFVLPLVVTFILLMCTKNATLTNQSSAIRRNSSIEYQQKIKKLEKKYFNLYAATTVLYAGVWTPYAVVSFLSVLKYYIPSLLSTAAALLVKLSAIINPIVNIWLNRRFRHYFLNIKPIQLMKKKMHSNTQDRQTSLKSLRNHSTEL